MGVPGNINFSDLTGNIAATQIDPTSITNDQLAGSISNEKLSNSNVIVAGKTINLGSSATIGFSDLTGNIAATQIDSASITNSQLAGSITNSKLANSNIVIGGQTINLGGSGSLAFSNITGNIAATQIDSASITNSQLAGSITNSKLVNSNIVIGNQTINLGGSGNIGLSNLSGVSITGSPSNGSILKYNAGTAVWEPFAPQFISLQFPNNDPFNVGSINFGITTLANLGGITSNIWSLNDSARSETSTIFRFSGLTNSYYKISSVFTFLMNAGSPDSGFTLMANRTNLPLTSSPQTFAVVIGTNSNVIGISTDSANNFSYGSSSIDSMVDFTTINPVPNIEIRFIQGSSQLNKFSIYSNLITIQKIL